MGSTFSGVAKVLGREIELTNEITAWDPPNEFGQKSTSGPVPWWSTWILEPKENGTQFTVNGQFEIGGFFKIAEGLVGRQIEKQGDADFKTLKQLLEAGKA